METNNFKIKPLGAVWVTHDPFLFCAHHNDQFPQGNEQLGPNKSLKGRKIGNDFQNIEGWNMYHGDRIPGFPEHPHRGFETITIVLSGTVDHADSTGACGRYSTGDVQWMTAGKGARHSEMFPLLNSDQDNPLDLFQIWLNLPQKDKFIEPHYKMLWREDIPVVQTEDSQIRIISGEWNGIKALKPTSHSWAHDHYVGIYTIELNPNGHLVLPARSKSIQRTLYYDHGESLSIEGKEITSKNRIELHGDESLVIENGAIKSQFLLLEGEPIQEVVVSYGPFVMNSEKEIIEAYAEFQKTGFGGWPWEHDDMVFPKTKGRFTNFGPNQVEEK